MQYIPPVLGKPDPHAAVGRYGIVCVRELFRATEAPMLLKQVVGDAQELTCKIIDDDSQPPDPSLVCVKIRVQSGDNNPVYLKFWVKPEAVSVWVGSFIGGTRRLVSLKRFRPVVAHGTIDYGC